MRNGKGSLLWSCLFFGGSGGEWGGEGGGSCTGRSSTCVGEGWGVCRCLWLMQAWCQHEVWGACAV